MSAITLESLRFPINYLQVSMEICAARQVDPVWFLTHQVGISPEALNDPQAQLTGRQFGWLLQQVSAYVSGGAECQRQLIEFFPPTIHGYVALAAMTSATVKDALDIAVTYSHQVMPAFRIAYSIEHRHCVITLNCLADFGRETALLTEMVLYALFALIQQYCREEAPTRVFLTHPQLVLSELPKIHRNLSIETGQPHNVVWLPVELLSSSLTTRNAVTFATIEQVLRKNEERLRQQHSLAYRVSASILGLMKDQQGVVSDQVAASLSMSPRTLSRRLNEEGTSFRTLHNECRIAIAKDLLSQEGMPISKISALIGFSDEANFSRFFKSQTGESPSCFRISIVRI